MAYSIRQKRMADTDNESLNEAREHVPNIVFDKFIKKETDVYWHHKASKGYSRRSWKRMPCTYQWQKHKLSFGRKAEILSLAFIDSADELLAEDIADEDWAYHDDFAVAA